MKYTAYTLLMALAFMVQGCTTPTPEAAPEGSTELSYTVYGMDCPGCHGGLEKNLEKIPGVTDALANWKQQTVTLRLTESSDVTNEQIKQAVQDSNFTLDDSTL